jgi:hypothetical protein
VLASALTGPQRAALPATLAVLKVFGPGNPAPLSFPRPGWSLALDFPADPILAPVLDDLDTQVAAAGGRVYLVKDSRLRPDVLTDMYPQLPGAGTVVLAGRDLVELQRAATALTGAGRRIETMHYDATAIAAATVDLLAAAAARVGDLDVIVLGVGVLTDEAILGADTVATEAALRATCWDRWWPYMRLRTGCARRDTARWWCCRRPRRCEPGPACSPTAWPRPRSTSTPAGSARQPDRAAPGCSSCARVR